MTKLTLKLAPDAAAKVAPRLGLVGLDPSKAAAREAARLAAVAAAAKAAAEAEAAAQAEAAKAAEKAAKLAAQKAIQLAAQARRKAAREAFTAQLCARWPDIFDVNAPKPLALGSDKAVRAAFPDVPEKVRRLALSRWTDKIRYHMAVAAGGPRYTLDGTEADAITEAQQAHAREVLAQRDAEAKARIASRQTGKRERRQAA